MTRVETASLEATVATTRRTAGLFRTDALGLLSVHGEDRVRWLDGMISGDVERLEREGEGAGCYATLLTNRGRIIADLHVGRLGDGFVIVAQRDAIGRVRETLDRFIIADDVTLEDESPGEEAFALEGPRAASVLRGIAEGLRDASDPVDEVLAPTTWSSATIAGVPVRVGAFGVSGEVAFRIFVARAEADAVFDALVGTTAGIGGVVGDAAALEVLRVEAGRPCLGAELDEDVFPPEAHLEHAIATDKGCYVGQEIVARLRSAAR